MLVVLEVPFNRMTGEADAELASNSGEASLGEGAASAAPDAAEPPQPQQQKGWPSKRLPRDTRYFVMKSFSMRDILISLKKGIWATQSRNEAKLNSAYSVRARCSLAATGPTRHSPPRSVPRGCEPRRCFPPRRPAPTSTPARRTQGSECVILFFSVNESRAFQGYAKMVRPCPG